uniref:Uncharacterized protein n=1 Tax=Oryza nivara TaxID=4536 RepID=A0A0E0G2K2_ORYNI
MEVEHLSPSRWRGSAASAAVPDVARARALLPHGGRTWTLGQKIKGHFWLTEERCQGRLTLAFQQQHVKLVPFDGVTRAEAGPQVIESWRRSMDGLSVITIQLRFDDQDAMLDDTLTGKGGQGIRAVAGTTTEESDTDAGDNVVVLLLALGAEAWRCCQYTGALWLLAMVVGFIKASILARLETDTVE